MSPRGPRRRGAAGRPARPLLTRSRSSLPALKNGTAFSSTGTASPVRGLRPVRASRRLTVNAPNPRSSTRSPRARAAVISLKIVLTISSMSRFERCALAADSSPISSDLVILCPARPTGPRLQPGADVDYQGRLPDRQRTVKLKPLTEHRFCKASPSTPPRLAPKVRLGEVARVEVAHRQRRRHVALSAASQARASASPPIASTSPSLSAWRPV